ncbi:MAG: glutamate--tRNA ligase [Flavobacteriales bacterium]|nr:glutamate--tRNA ligase [Flavobacteriales bacterium]
MSVRLRFAPSPTGPLHMGGVRTALYNFLFARQQGGALILRIEDTDRTRFVPGAEEYIREALSWCGITFDEDPWQGGPHGPYRQSERKDMYRAYVDMLVQSDKAYYAFDTPAELEAMRARLKAAGSAAPAYNSVTREHMQNSLTLSADVVRERLERGDEHVVRLKVPRHQEVRFEDQVRGWVVVHSSHIDDKVLFKSDGMPTYHLANIVDDHAMGITHVIRGEEWLPSAPLHVLLYEAFEWERPHFAHLPLILKPDGKGKLSKRDGDRLGFPVFPLDWVDPGTGERSSGYRERGYFPEAFVNMLALLGWNPGTEQELFSMEELIASFDIRRVNKSGARFDPDKTNWFNQQYLRKRPDAELGEGLQQIMGERAAGLPQAYLTRAAGLLKERATFVSEMSTGAYLFPGPVAIDGTELKKRWEPDLAAPMARFADKLEALRGSFNAQAIEHCFKAHLEMEGSKMGKFMPLFRLFVAGTTQGPGMFEVSELLGADEVIGRIRTGLELVSQWGSSK